MVNLSACTSLAKIRNQSANQITCKILDKHYLFTKRLERIQEMFFGKRATGVGGIFTSLDHLAPYMDLSLDQVFRDGHILKQLCSISLN